MFQTRDKRRRSDLDLFILALIDGGVSTPYDLQSAAGLSQGATIPALQRLLEAKFIRQEKPGPRGRSGYQITAAGRRLLTAGWLPLVEAGPSGNLESDLRVALLAIWGGDDRRHAEEFLRKSAEKKLQSINIDDASDASGGAAALARWYTDLLSKTKNALLIAESDAIGIMADNLPASPGKKSSRRPPSRKR